MPEEQKCQLTTHTPNSPSAPESAAKSAHFSYNQSASDCKNGEPVM